MGVDKGETIYNKLIRMGYVKTVPNGYLFSREGLEWIFNSIEELYHIHTNVHTDTTSNADCTGRCGGAEDCVQPE